MNILIADSGATKTDWVLTGTQHQFIQSRGLNPHMVSAKEFVEVLSREVKPNLNGQGVSSIYFYGSGCGDELKKQEVRLYLQKMFEFAEIHIGTDLDGAGKAIYSDQPGLVGILGTGSSAGFYDGNNIVRQMPSEEYPFGDEGSGSDIGKRVLLAQLQGELPADLKAFLDGKMNTDIEEQFYVFQQPSETKKFVSKIGKLMGDYADHPFMQQTIRDGFEAYIKKITDFFYGMELRSIGMVGTVASVYEDEMREVFQEYGVSVESIIQSPINKLAERFN
ncbi:MAG: hypothetical protein FH748_07115 [Balneolaceae bacterium]|nr:hypothetical protein [Balneolaceae bacterium]